MSKVTKYYFFTSEHFPRDKKYNEVHPCRIVRTKWYERGWYLNSFYRISRFSGYKLGRISFGFVSGYAKFRVPYVAYHWEGGFTLPVGGISWLIGSGLRYIRCTYGERNVSSATKLLWKKIKNNT